jgi:hypothetical protein
MNWRAMMTKKRTASKRRGAQFFAAERRPSITQEEHEKMSRSWHAE